MGSSSKEILAGAEGTHEPLPKSPPFLEDLLSFQLLLPPEDPLLLRGWPRLWALGSWVLSPWRAIPPSEWERTPGHCGLRH